jgi:hypothetical protein
MHEIYSSMKKNSEKMSHSKKTSTSRCISLIEKASSREKDAALGYHGTHKRSASANNQSAAMDDFNQSAAMDDLNSPVILSKPFCFCFIIWIYDN